MIVWVLLTALIKPNGEIDVNTKVYRNYLSCDIEADRQVDLHRAKAFVRGDRSEGKLFVVCDKREVQY